MSFYTSSVQTQLLDPRLDQSNRRAEFRFNKDTTYLSNMRLAQIGITATNDEYNSGAGAYECIKKISLLDGNTSLAETPALEFPRYMVWKNYTKENSSNRAINGFLSKNAFGYEVGRINSNEVGSVSAIKLEQTFSPRQYNTTLATTQEGWLDLKDALPFLSSVLSLDTSIFKNLRLVIEFNSAVGTNQNTTAPLLICDAMQDESVKSKLRGSFKGAEFISVEHDRFNLEAVPDVTAANPNPVQSVTKQIKGFDNKVLTRLIVMKEPNGSDVTEFSSKLARLGSVLGFQEKSNLRVNGRTMLVGDGLDTPNKALASVVDVFGDCNSYLNQMDLPAKADGESTLAANLSDMLGELDYRCFLVSERCEQVEYINKRTGEHDNTLTDPNQKNILPNMPLVMHFFGEIRKSLVVNSDGSYLISYA